MNQDANKPSGFEIELNLRIAARDYRLQFKNAAGWIVAVILVLVKVGLSLVRDGPR